METVTITESKYNLCQAIHFGIGNYSTAQCAYRMIKNTIPQKHYSEPGKAHFGTNLKCTACMLGKARLQPYPKTEIHAKRPLERIYIDIVSSSVTSIEGYDCALVITDDSVKLPCIAGCMDSRKRAMLMMQPRSGYVKLSKSGLAILCK